MIERIAATILVGVLFVNGSVFAQSHGLSETEVARALDLEEKFTSAQIATPAAARDRGIPALANTQAGKAGKSVVVDVSPVGSRSTVAAVAAAGGQSVRRAATTKYDYPTGFTTIMAMDLQSNKVIAVRKKLNYPTPLATSELEEAKSLLIASVPSVKQIIEDSSDEVLFEFLTPVSNNVAAPRYGHRIVILWLTKPKYTRKFLVDLHTLEVENWN